LIFSLAYTVWSDVRGLKSAKSDNIQWNLSQLEIDYLNLAAAHESALLERSQTLDNFQNRFDVFYSRVSTFQDSSIYDVLQVDSRAKLMLDRIWSFTAETATAFDTNHLNSNENIGVIGQSLDSIGSDVRDLSLIGIKLFAIESEQQRQQVSQTMTWIGLLSVTLTAAIIALMWMFFRQYRRMQTQVSDVEIASSRLNAVVTSSLDAVIVINRAAKILEFNSAAQDIFGYSKDEAVGGDLAEMIVPEHFRQAHKDGMQRYLDTGEKKVVGKGRVQLEARNKVGDIFPIELSISAAESHEGEIFVAFLRDISERVEAEEQLKLARDNALEGQKAKARLLAVMSHEMRTPLNGMLGTLELMQDTHLSVRQRQYLEIIDTSGKLLLHHVNDVLDISRLDSGKFETDLKKIDISNLLAEICDSQRPNAKAKGNVIETDFAALEDQIVIGDDLRLRQVLLNVIGNAIKFTVNGTISVETERLDGDVVDIRISDDGIGIHDSDQEKIFEDFVSLDSSYERTQAGTGLGLGITKRMIEAMGGQIGVESIKDEGSIFWIRLPLPQIEDDEVSQESLKAFSDDTIPPQHILIVEDNRINRFVVREMLEKDGHTVFEANDGEEGVSACGYLKFDTILMDISMPRIDGIKATKLIRSGGGPSSKTPIIALTAHALPDEIIKFNEAGMNDTLIKPISRGGLRKVLRMAANLGEPTVDAPDRKISDGLVDEEALSELMQTLGKAKSKKLIREFVVEAESELKWVSEKASINENRAELVRRVHKLAGSASMFGATGLHQTLFEIESICKSQTTDGLDEAISALPNTWQETKQSYV
jgi:PAS domain S-box-containing protein